MIEKKLAIRPSSPTYVDEAADQVLAVVGERRLERLDQRVARVLEQVGARGAGGDDEDRGGEDDQRQHRADDALAACPWPGPWTPRRPAARPRRRGRTRSRTATPPRCRSARTAGTRSTRPRTSSTGMLFRLDGSNFGIAAITNTTRANDGDRGDREHHLERLAHAEEVHADEDQVEDEVDVPAVGDPEQSERLDVGADEVRDRGRRDGVLDEDRRAGEEAAPRPQRAPREGVAAAGGRDASRRARRARRPCTVYITAMRIVAISSPPQPPSARPKFQPA